MGSAKEGGRVRSGSQFEVGAGTVLQAWMTSSERHQSRGKNGGKAGLEYLVTAEGINARLTYGM